MKLKILICIFALLSACSAPTFVGDAPPITVTANTPDHFKFPARFAVARVVYGSVEAAGSTETALWTELAARAKSLGSFAPLVAEEINYRYYDRKKLITAARNQRFNYLLTVHMHPSTGSANISIVHVGSGGTMATAQAVSPSGGQRGFWGGWIRNPTRLERATLKIGKAAIPVVEEMLNGAAMRQR